MSTLIWRIFDSKFRKLLRYTCILKHSDLLVCCRTIKVFALPKAFSNMTTRYHVIAFELLFNSYKFTFSKITIFFYKQLRWFAIPTVINSSFDLIDYSRSISDVDVFLDCLFQSSGVHADGIVQVSCVYRNLRNEKKNTAHSISFRLNLDSSNQSVNDSSNCFEMTMTMRCSLKCWQSAVQSEWSYVQQQSVD